MDDKAKPKKAKKTGFYGRMDHVINLLGGPRAASAVVGMTEDSLCNWREGRANPKFKNVAMVAKAANVSLDWLAFGRGKAPPMAIEALSGPEGEEADDVVFASISRLDLPLYGGAVRTGDTLRALGIEPAWVNRVLRADASRLSLLTAVGDQMEPTIRTGDIVLFDTSVHRVTESGIYVLDLNGTAAIRRVQTCVDGEVRIKSDHPSYDEERLSPSQAESLSVFGLVRWVGKIL